MNPERIRTWNVQGPFATLDGKGEWSVSTLNGRNLYGEEAAQCSSKSAALKVAAALNRKEHGK